MKKTKILIATLMIAVILVAGIGAYYWLKQDQVKKDNQRSTMVIKKMAHVGMAQFL